MNLHRDKFISGCKFDGTNSKNASNLVPNAINKVKVNVKLKSNQSA